MCWWMILAALWFTFRCFSVKHSSQVCVCPLHGDSANTPTPRRVKCIGSRKRPAGRRPRLVTAGGAFVRWAWLSRTNPYWTSSSSPGPDWSICLLMCCLLFRMEAPLFPHKMMLVFEQRRAFHQYSKPSWLISATMATLMVPANSLAAWLDLFWRHQCPAEAGPSQSLRFKTSIKPINPLFQTWLIDLHAMETITNRRMLTNPDYGILFRFIQQCMPPHTAPMQHVVHSRNSIDSTHGFIAFRL